MPWPHRPDFAWTTHRRVSTSRRRRWLPAATQPTSALWLHIQSTHNRLDSRLCRRRRLCWRAEGVAHRATWPARGSKGRVPAGRTQPRRAAFARAYTARRGDPAWVRNIGRDGRRAAGAVPPCHTCPGPTTLRRSISPSGILVDFFVEGNVTGERGNHLSHSCYCCYCCCLSCFMDGFGGWEVMKSW